MKKTFWGNDRNGESHRIQYNTPGKSEAICNLPVEIVAIRFTDQPDNPCAICKGEVSFPKGTSVLLHEDRKQST